MEKLLTKKQLKKRDRDYRIKIFYQNLPPDMRSYEKVAKYFGVSKTTVAYAITGRNKKNIKRI